MPTVTLARHAMATRFELVLHGDNPVSLRAAGEEALDEIDRLEAQLSLYRPSSEIARLNARAAREVVRVTPPLFRLLEHARRLHQETGGAFDITIAPLVRCWGFMGGSGSLPSPGQIAEARAKVGMGLVLLDPENVTVRFAREGVMIDLGAIGKGYAIQRAADVLRETGVTNALIHGGTSTIYALGQPPGADAWQVAIEHPASRVAPQESPETGSCAVLRPAFSPASPPSSAALSSAESPQLGAASHSESFISISLRDEALSVSAVWGKSFQAEGKTYGHILDPRTGWPAAGAVLAAVACVSATETDALSTALLTLGQEGHQHVGGLRPGMRTLVASETKDGFSLQTLGTGWRNT